MENYKYDIFISYKHEVLDKAVAARLQKSLEHYKIPKEIQKKTGKEKIKRVFRDEEELAVSSDLGKEIEGQIAQSEYLLVVCSKKTKESQWVLKEIDTFLKYRDAEHILPVLIEGEPEESFPESILAYGEPMAADVREKSEKEVLKKVKKELPRIIAPVLQCSYDELKQRHKIYQMYRLLGIAAVIMCFLSVFAGYALFQSKKSQEEYLTTRKNQARYLCNISNNLLQTGDRMGALKTALAILPENKKENKPIVPEQFYALNNALYSYKHDNLLYFRANRMQKLKGTVEGEVKFSDKGTYCVAVDSNRYAYFFDGKTGKLLWRAESESLTGEKTGIYAAAPLDENTAALVTETKLVIVDINRKHGQKIYDSHFEKTYTNGEVNLFIVNKKAVLWDAGRISVIELKNGKELYCKEREDTVRENIEQVIADKKGEKIFIAVSGELKSEKEDGTGDLVYSEKNKKGKAGIYCYTLKSKKLERISVRATQKMCLINKKYIAAVQYTTYRHPGIIAEATYSLALYNINTGKRVWEQGGLKENDTNVKADCQCFDIKQNNKKNKKILVFYCRNTVYCLDTNTHKLLSQTEYDEPITGVRQYDDTKLLLGLEDGTVYIYIGYDKESMKYYSNWAMNVTKAGKIDNEFKIEHFSYDMRGVTALEYGEKKIIFMNLIQDNNVKFLDGNDRIEKVFYQTIEQSKKKTVYRCIKYSGVYTGENPRVAIYKCGENKPIYTISIKNKDESIEGVTLGLKNGKVVICYIIKPEIDWKSADKKKPVFYMADLQTKKIIGRCKLPSQYIYDDSIIYANDLSYIWIWENTNDDIWHMCLTQNKLQLKKEKQWRFEASDSIEKIQCTKDNHYLVILCSDHSSDKTKYYLKIWDRTAKQYKEIDGDEKILNIEDENGFAVGKKKNLIAISQKDEVIRIINIDKGKTEKVINDYKNNEDTEPANNSMSFFCRDKYLLRSRPREKLLSMLDVETGEILTEEKENIVNKKIIVDDSTEYFGLKDTGGGKEGDLILTETMRIYTLNQENQTFVKYADIDYGWASFEGKEVIGEDDEYDHSQTYYTDFYSFSQLKKQAEKLLDGEKLTAQEKRKYFLENQ